MKHNKICLGFALLLSVVTLSGCMNVKNLSDEESDMIAEYSAGVLLRYSEDYPYRLITKEQRGENIEATATPMPTATVAPTEEPAASGNAIDAQEMPDAGGEVAPEENNVSLKDLYQLSGIEISYKSYEFTGSYGKGVSQILAEDDKNLLVVKFDVRNTSGTAKKVDLMNRGIEYNLNVDGSEYLPGISILENGGLNYLKTTVPKGKSEEAVLIYSVAKEQKNATAISLDVKAGEKVTRIQLK